MTCEFNMYMQMQEMQPRAEAPLTTLRMPLAPPMHAGHAQYPASDYVHQYNNFGVAVGMPIGAYPMTAAPAGGRCGPAAPPALPAPPAPSAPAAPDGARGGEPTRSRKRKPRLYVSKSDYGSGGVVGSGGVGVGGGCASDCPAAAALRLTEPPPRKSKSSFGATSALEDDGEDFHSLRTSSDKKQNHSEIEKRRRDKMNTYITELGTMVPMCRALNRKLDKLTILRLAVQHLRTVRGAISAGPLTIRPLPAILSQAELNALVVRAASGCFVVVVGCDRGRMMYVSASVAEILNFHQTELLGQSFFDLLHPKDVAKVKEQMSSSESGPRERLIDAKTMLPVKANHESGVTRLSPGSRRSFYCRVKCQAIMGSTLADPMKIEPDMPRKRFNKKYCLVQCTGYLKAWAPGDMSDECEGENDRESGLVPCLVAIARAMPDSTPPAAADGPAPHGSAATPASVRPLQYISRHAPDGKFLFVDQRVTIVLGFLPHELVGTSIYEYVVGDDNANCLADAHRETLLKKIPVETPPYVIRRKDGSNALLITHFKYLNNPWTKELECLVANNTLLSERPQEHHEEEDDEKGQYPDFKDVLSRPSVNANSQINAQAIAQKILEASAQTNANSEWSTQARASYEVSAQLSANYEWSTQINANSEWSTPTNAHFEVDNSKESVLGSDNFEKSLQINENSEWGAHPGAIGDVCPKKSAQMSTELMALIDVISKDIPNGNAQTSTKALRSLRAQMFAERSAKARTQTSAEITTQSYSQPSAEVHAYRSVAEAYTKEGAALANAINATQSVEAYTNECLEAYAKESALESVTADAEGSTKAEEEPGADTTSALSHLTEAVGEEVQRMIVARAASLRLGAAIAEEARRRGPRAPSPDPSLDLLHDAVFSHQPSLVDSLLNCDSPYSYVRNNVSLCEAGGNDTPPPENIQSEQQFTGCSPPPTSPLLPIPIDGNGEAAMAVLMNLLEADAGLGGPVNMSALPWLFP